MSVQSIFSRLFRNFVLENISMSTSTGLSTVSELVKHTSLLNQQQYLSAKQGLEFAETAIKTTKLTFASQQNKLDNSFHNGILSKDDYDKQMNQLKHQFDLDCVPWEIYVKKLTHLIEQYSSQDEQQRNKKRKLEQCSPSKTKIPSSSVAKRSHISFSSSSSDSDIDEPIPPTIEKKPTPKTINHDSSTNTDPLEFSLRSPFPSTPNIISFTAQTNHITGRVPLQHINEIAAKHIVLLHDEGQLVRWNDVICRILTYFRVQDLGNLGVQRADQIPCIENLIRTQNKINIYLDAYTYWSTMGTLNELENDLARIFYKKDYNELLIGPIEKQAKIEELFRLRTLRNEPIKKDLKSSDILKYLDQYMTKECVWKTENEISLERFLKYVAEQVQVKNIHQLGIRIKSVYLARNCIKAMQANQRKTMEIARTELNQILVELAKKEVDKILQTINNKLGNDQRQIYASMEPLDIINDLIEICRDLCQNYPSFRKISHALDIITKDPMLKNIFQIAICHGHLGLPDQTTQPAKKIDQSTRKKIYFDSSDSDDEFTTPTSKPEVNTNHPPESELLQAFKEQIGSIKIIKFSFLARMEQRLCEKFQSTHFHELGYGTFMDYIQRNQQLLFAADIKFNLSLSESTGSNTATIVPFEDVEQFILQALNQSADQHYIEQMSCYHFQIESFEHLGHGSFRSVLNSIKQNKKPIKTFIHYECIMLNETSLFNRTPSVQDMETQALHAINQCPLLGNLHVDTQWNLCFRPILGKIKPFLIRYSFPILEIDHSTLLKLSTNSTLELFKESLYNYDSILTAGHLVSILVQHGSLHNAPLSLLANIVHTFLLTVSHDNRFYNFLIHIFHRIPYQLLSSIIQRIFLEPLIKLEGSPRKVRELLWTTIDTQDPNILMRFIQLGNQLGFTEWSIDRIKPFPSIKLPQEKQSTISIPTIVTTSSISKVESRLSSQHPYDLIERIRREKFGIGLNLSNESQQLTDQLKSLVGRSLERLSKELYNTDMHFVLELIQNADDNQYNTKPTLVFVIDSNSINIYNNEVGFQENNIQALCDIGKSTKGKHQHGYIGQKGIGFKSIFTVCDRPEIYSNGYQICFDAHNGSIGYILPNWIETEHRDDTYLNWMTRICLPLKSENEMQKHKSRSLTESFNDIHPSLLLFLNRLRSITLDNRLTGSKQTYERIDLPGTNIVEIHGGEMTEQWFVIRKQLIIPDEIKMDLDNVIEATEIALAFPLHEIRISGDIVLTKKQDVFAYLPLRTFGFSFIIQADFEVPSSRQDILSDSLWNQFLLSEIPSLFLSSLDAFHQERSSLPIDPLQLFLAFLPNETSVYTNNLFTPICRTILHSLRSRRFLPVRNDHHLHMPNECVLIHDSTLREILTPELLYNYLNLYYLNDDLYQHEKQLYELGVHRFGHNELLDIIKRMFTSEITFANKQLLSKWFSCLYRCLNELSFMDEDNVLKHIQSLKIFPLKNQQDFITLNHNQQRIFFPAVNLRLPILIEHDLLIIDEELWMNFKENSLERIQIQTLLERLGIQRLTHRAICEQHIFPIFENEQLWKEKSTDVLIAYVMYIFDLWSQQKQYIDMSRVKSIVRLLTNDNYQQPTHTSIHFTPEYGNPYDLSRDFNTYNWIVLSNEYIRQLSSSNDRKRLHQFFSELGVTDFLFPVNSWTYEQFNSIISLQSISMNKKLFLAFQTTWSKAHEKELFLQHLKDSIWIPSVQTIYSYNEQTTEIEINKIRTLDKSNHIYLKSKQIQQLFGQHVPYIDVEIDSNSSFANDLNLIEHITLNDIISMLTLWCKKSIMHTSISHMQNIYEYIYQHMSINELRDFINNQPIFFVPVSSLSTKQTIVRGKFVSKADVCWCDPTNLLAKFRTENRCILEPYYTEQKSIFLDTFAIPTNPSIEEYIDLLVHIASLKTTDETIRDVFLIFKTIGQWYEQSNNLVEQENLQTKLSHKPIFPTKDHRWVSINDNPLISDNDDIATSIDNIPLIDISSSDALRFLTMCGIKSLSSSITIEHTIENPSDGIFIQNLLAPLIPYIQLFMKSRPEFSQAYQWTKSINMSELLLKIQFIIVDYLQLIYRIQSDSSICLIREEKSYYDTDEMCFYIHREWIEQPKYYRDIFHSFARIFIPYHNTELTRSLGNFMNLLYNEKENTLEVFAKYQQFDLELTDSDDIPWYLPCTSTQIKCYEPQTDESKVRTLLENVAQNQEQYNAYKQKKRRELQSQLSATTDKYQTSSDDSGLRFDNIRSTVDTSCETIEQCTRNFNIEDLTHQVLDNRDSAIGSDQKSLEKIGRWGEQWVNEYLRTKYHDKLQSNEIEIIWFNENIEQGKPYDFVLKNLKSQTLTYIEVKSTLSNNRQLIPITFNELQHCCSLSDMINQHFQIYRVYNTGQLKKVKLRIVENVEEKIRKHALELFLLI